MAKRMTLISEQELANLKKYKNGQCLSDEDPSTEKMALLNEQMDDVMNNSKLSSRDKMLMYAQVMRRYVNVRKQQMDKPASIHIGRGLTSDSPTSSPAFKPEYQTLNDNATKSIKKARRYTANPDDNDSMTAVHDDIIYSVPPRDVPRVKKLMKRIKKNSEIINWNNKHEIIYNGAVIPKSNIADVFMQLYGAESPIKTAGYNAFLQAAADLNIPISMLGNKQSQRSLEKRKYNTICDQAEKKQQPKFVKRQHASSESSDLKINTNKPTADNNVVDSTAKWIKF